MEIKYSKEERKAINKKLENPNDKVLCPRCGKELVFREKGTSYSVKCLSDNCLVANFRGI